MPKAQNFLITKKSNIQYLSNFNGSSGFMLITKNKSYLFTDSRYIERAKNSIKKGIEVVDTTRVFRNPKQLKENWQKILKKYRIKTLGVEESNLTVSRHKFFKKISSNIKLVDISGHFEKIREIKTRTELSYLKKSQKINEKVFKEIKKIILNYTKGKTKKAPTEAELAWKIKELGHQYGANDLSFDPIVAFGKNSAIPHHEPGNTKLKKGHIVLIDMGMKYKDYCSDMTRTFFTAKPTKDQKKVYNTVLKAQKNAIKNIKAGITGKKADALSREIIKKAGYGNNYTHAGGHGVGLDIHESPSLSSKSKEVFKKGTVVTVEPGIYLPGKFGVRIEDMILITKSGNKNLTKMPKAL